MEITTDHERGIRLVADTNVFVAAGFNSRSSSARIMRRVRGSGWGLVWNGPTRGEIEAIVRRIPVLSNRLIEAVFLEANHFKGTIGLDGFAYVADPADRKFAALAVAADVPLVTNDQHLLVWRDRIPTQVMTPGEWMRLHG